MSQVIGDSSSFTNSSGGNINKQKSLSRNPEQFIIDQQIYES